MRQLKRPKLQGLTVDKLRELVETNDKQRYKLSSEPDPLGGEEVLWVRANQGHSVEVTESFERPALTLPGRRPRAHVGHRPGRSAYSHPRHLQALLARHRSVTQTCTFSDPAATEGLRSMKRSHIHCTTGMLGAEGVKSGAPSASQIAPADCAGMRASCDLFIHIDVAAAMAGASSPVVRY